MQKKKLRKKLKQYNESLVIAVLYKTINAKPTSNNMKVLTRNGIRVLNKHSVQSKTNQ
jgi:hypothetical protein